MKKEFSKFYAWSKVFGWDMLTKYIAQHNIEVVWDFYANILIVDWSVPFSTTRVWEKRVIVDLATINDTFSVQNPSNATLEVRIQASKLEWEDEVLAFKRWATKVRCSSVKVTKSTYLLIEARVWLQLVFCSILLCVALQMWPFIRPWWWLVSFQESVGMWGHKLQMSGIFLYLGEVGIWYFPTFLSYHTLW